MKKCWMLLLVLSLVAALVPLTSCGVPEPELTYSENFYDMTGTVTGVKNYPETELVIPSVSPDGCTVTQISAKAFIGCSNFSAITVPDSVNYIGKSAFFGCSTLKSITLPFIGETRDGSYRPRDFKYVFGDDVPLSLETVVITGGTTVPDWAFWGQYNLKSITIPGSITWVGEGAFSGCASLQTITYDGTMKSWQSVEKDSRWRFGCPIRVICCTDGVVTY